MRQRVFITLVAASGPAMRPRFLDLPGARRRCNLAVSSLASAQTASSA